MGLQSKRYMSPKQYAAWQKTAYGRYSTSLQKHPFLLFGLPFMATLFMGSIYLAEFTSVRYEQYDEKVTLVSLIEGDVQCSYLDEVLLKGNKTNWFLFL